MFLFDLDAVVFSVFRRAATFRTPAFCRVLLSCRFWGKLQTKPSEKHR